MLARSQVCVLSRVSPYGYRMARAVRNLSPNLLSVSSLSTPLKPTQTSHVRPFAATTNKAAMNVFDRSVVRLHRDNAASHPDAADYDYLKDEIASVLVDRLDDISRKFESALEIGCGSGHINRWLADKGKVQAIHCIDSSQANIARAQKWYQSAKRLAANAPSELYLPDEENIRNGLPIPDYRKVTFEVCKDEEFYEIPEGKYDLIISNMNMHWINDVPGFLTRIRKALKPDGVFLASMIGGSTLQELRSAFAVADTERLGGVMPHISPFAYGRDCGDLLQRAGFALPTVDTASVVVPYPDMFTLMSHLQHMGENNAAWSRPAHVSRDVFLSAASVYEALYGEEQELESGPLSSSSTQKNTVRIIPATFQLFYLIGWAPHHSQRQPKARGSATHSLTDIEEIAAQLSEQEKEAQSTTKDQSCSNEGCQTGGCQSNKKKEQGEFVLNDK